MYYEIKVKAETLDEKTASVKSSIQEYLVENIELFAEAEQMGLKMKDTTDVVFVKRSRVMEVVNIEDPAKDESLYRATIEATTVDESFKEKKIKYEVMVWAADVMEAQQRMNEYMKQGLDDMELIALKKTKIQEIL